MSSYIYEPAEDSYLLAEQVKKHAFGKVLDVGTGSGIQAIAASNSKKVKSVLAVDINEEAVDFVKNKIKEEIKNKKENNSFKKIKVIQSDLFLNVSEKFDTVIFNPPYLPLDEKEPEDSRLATTGGKHGYELLHNFLLGLNEHLTEEGFALILFSSLTNKEKVEEFVEEICFDFEKLSEQKISFENLYVYKIKRSKMLNDLLKKNVKDVKKFALGKRGVVFTGMLGKRKIAIKIQRKDVKTETVNKESKIISVLNKRGIGPALIFAGESYFACEFIEGKTIDEYLKTCSEKEAKTVFLEVLNQCRILDKLKITKEEMTNPYKHVIIGRKIVMIDFERAHYDLQPGNVTQFCQYILSKLKMIPKDEFISLGKEYKKNPTEENYLKIKSIMLN